MKLISKARVFLSPAKSLTPPQMKKLLDIIASSLTTPMMKVWENLLHSASTEISWLVLNQKLCKTKTYIHKSDTSNNSALSFEKMLILNVQHFVYKQSFLRSELHNTPNRKLHCLSYNPRWIDVFALSYLRTLRRRST